MERIIVNWVKEDEELLEPYEWCQGDDIEIISSLLLIRVDETTLHDFIYGCLNLFDKELYNKVFIVGDGHYAIVVEINDIGKLCYRSVLSIEDRSIINQEISKLELKTIHYHMYDEGEMKEYGLTRNERIKKQFVENKLDEIYIDNYDMFLSLCQQLHIKDESSINMYLNLKKKIEHGYSFIHELLYYELSKTKYKRNKP